ncbi:hypothetical protein EDB89DRAFT_157867 [Lactarius sanguifluus]|nr:hypothetical protein EDB89DRAFT_157867 [Lactarius sanguifluus]
MQRALTREDERTDFIFFFRYCTGSTGALTLVANCTCSTQAPILVFFFLITGISGSLHGTFSHEHSLSRCCSLSRAPKDVTTISGKLRYAERQTEDANILFGTSLLLYKVRWIERASRRHPESSGAWSAGRRLLGTDVGHKGSDSSQDRDELYLRLWMAHQMHQHNPETENSVTHGTQAIRGPGTRRRRLMITQLEQRPINGFHGICRIVLLQHSAAELLPWEGRSGRSGIF